MTTKTVTKKAKIEQKRSDEVLAFVAETNIEKAIAELDKSKLETQRAISAVSVSLAEKYSKFQEVAQAYELKKMQLSELQQIEVNSNTLDELKVEIEKVRAAWAVEQADREASQTAEEEMWMAEQVKKHNEWLYKNNQEHTKKLDELNQQIARVKRDEELRHEAFEKNLSTRESDLKSREQELIDLRIMTHNFPEEIKSEVAREVAIATNSLKKDLEHKFEITQKDSQLKLALAESERHNAEQKAIDLANHVKQLEVEMAKAYASAKEVATEALKSASGRDAMAALQKVVEKDNQPGTQRGR
jgi:hypothetical protein